MATNGFGPTPGHIGRIPNYGKTQVNPMGNIEPPACIQNAMMTKDKKPFTYTPGGLDLSQIRTPSMARRMARQRSLEDHEQAYAAQQPNGGNYHPQGGAKPPPPPPPPSIPAPPPPPLLVIPAPSNKSPKPIAPGERPEIVIPENPIGMLRKTNSPYHWEAEKAELQRIGPVPKFVEKVPSPLTVKLPSQNMAQNYSPQFTNTIQNNQAPNSPLHRPEAQYSHQNSGSPNVIGSPQTRETLLRQDSQFNKSPQPFNNQSPLVSSPYSPTSNNHWRQPERRDSPGNSYNSPQSPQLNREQFSPHVQQNSPSYQPSTPNNNVFHTLPRAGQRNQQTYIPNTQNQFNNSIPNNIKETPAVNSSNPAPWRTNTLSRHSRDNQNDQQQAYSPTWKANENTNQTESTYSPPWARENKNNLNQNETQTQYNPPWPSQDSNNNKVQTANAPWRSQEATSRPSNQPTPVSPPESRYQTSISIPVTPRKQNSQPEYNNSPKKEVVYVNQEPIYYCPESPKSIPPWVKTQKEKTKTPPPVWCQRPLEGRISAPRELATPPRETNDEPEWVRKSNDIQRGAREVLSPPKYQQTAQPNWSTRPSENRKSLPKDNVQGSRIIPIQMEVSSTETRNQGRQGGPQPQLRIVIDMKPNQDQNQTNIQAPYSQPTQRIMRVLSPQLVRTDEGSYQTELPSLNRNIQNNQDNQPKTRIIPIQIESTGNSSANKSVYFHKFSQEGPPRQSKAFKVLQVITDTQDPREVFIIEKSHGYSDL